MLRRLRTAFAKYWARWLLALLLIGIHNAWDTVTHLVVTESGSVEDSD